MEYPVNNRTLKLQNYLKVFVNVMPNNETEFAKPKKDWYYDTLSSSGGYDYIDWDRDYDPKKGKKVTEFLRQRD